MPTVRPVLARSFTASLATMGEMQPRMALGRTNRAPVRARMRQMMFHWWGTRLDARSTERMTKEATPPRM